MITISEVASVDRINQAGVVNSSPTFLSEKCDNGIFPAQARLRSPFHTKRCPTVEPLPSQAIGSSSRALYSSQRFVVPLDSETFRNFHENLKAPASDFVNLRYLSRGAFVLLSLILKLTSSSFKSCEFSDSCERQSESRRKQSPMRLCKTKTPELQRKSHSIASCSKSLESDQILTSLTSTCRRRIDSRPPDREILRFANSTLS
jgi:hypothetical protein